MLCAIIKDDIVAECPVELDEAGIQARAQIDLVIAIDGFDPIPKVGWHHVGGNLIDPDLIGNGGAVLLTQFAFFNRFTPTEMATFEGFMDAGPAPYKYIARGFKTALLIASYIDRTWAATKDGMGFLVQVGVLTLTRHNEIMNTPAKPHEIYRGKK